MKTKTHLTITLSKRTHALVESLASEEPADSMSHTIDTLCWEALCARASKDVPPFTRDAEKT